MAETGARQYHRRVSGIIDVDRNARRDQFTLAGVQRQRRLHARAQIKAGGAGGGVLRELIAQARVENFYVEFHFGVSERVTAA